MKPDHREAEFRRRETESKKRRAQPCFHRQLISKNHISEAMLGQDGLRASSPSSAACERSTGQGRAWHNL